jgi:hypothetical protein
VALGSGPATVGGVGAGGMLSSSSSPCLAVADIRSLISRHAGGAHALDVATVSRFGAAGGDGRWI